MCLALGRNVSPNQEINLLTFQRDIAPTVGTLLGFETPYATGQNLYGIDPALPVTLISFAATVTGSTVKLKWKTETEVNNFGFDVERTTAPGAMSSAGRDWQKIGFVAGAGNSNSLKEYSFSDDNIYYGKHLYRLKQFDNDGTFAYSKIIEIIVGEIPDLFVLEQNYPKPFNPNTIINYSLPIKSQVTLVVYNILGENVKQLVNGEKNVGRYSVEFNAVELPGGVYFYILQTDSFIQTRKMLLLK